MLWVNVLQMWVLLHMGVRFLAFRDSFPSLNPHDPFATPSTILLADLQEWQSLLHIKALLTSLTLFYQSISSHHRLVSSLAFCWSILLRGLSFFHALSYFPAPSSFLERLFFVLLVPWCPHSTVGPPYHIYLCTGKKTHHIHSHPLFWLLKKITGSQYITGHLKWSPGRVSNMSVIFWVETMYVCIFPNCDGLGFVGFVSQLRLRFQIYSSFQMRMSQTAGVLLKISHFEIPHFYLLNLCIFCFTCNIKTAEKCPNQKWTILTWWSRMLR